MALAISNIPILTGDVAEEFIRNAEYNSSEVKRISDRGLSPVR